MKKVYYSFVFLTFCLDLLFAQGQQLPNSNCNDWSGEKFDGKIQPKSWNYSNVTQVSMKFNFAQRETGRSGQSGDYSMKVEDQELGAIGITETSPGYIALGQPWAYLEGLNVSSATAGTYGGIAWNSRPDTLSLWIKRTGPNWKDENYNILYYAWKGTAKGDSYKNKAGKCTSIERTDEESDIRIALDENECHTITKGQQVCEGWIWERKEYPNWTNIRIPIYYMNNEIPENVNVILSASNYPNFRANSGLYAGNSLYIDDMELIYSASIQQLVIDDRVWEEFNPNTDEVQVYELGRDAVSIPKIEAKRGIGSLTNPMGGKADFLGRVLSGKEIEMTLGAIGDTSRITVFSEDGKSQKTYRIRFVREASANTQLDGIEVNGQPLDNFNPKVMSYNYALPFGSVEQPVVSCTKHEQEQTVEIMQAASQTGTATILVTAANGKNQATYTIRFSVEELKDNTLKNILVNGQSVPGFLPTRTNYRVSLPVDTETMPTVEAVSAYPSGMQTIVYTAPAVIDGGVYSIAVSTPGNPTPTTYKLTFKLEPSSYAYLKDLRMGDGEKNWIEDFEPEKLTYAVSLPLGTLALPTITPVKGDNFQTVEVQYGDLNGQSRVLVTAGDGATMNLYKINVTTEVSSTTTLNAIYINGEPLANFDKQTLSYTYDLPIGTTEMPVVTVDSGDEYQVVTITYGGLNGITRILVTAANGSTRLYQIQFRQQLSKNNSLKMISVGGEPLQDFDPDKTEYDYLLPAGTTSVPEVIYEPGDIYQTISTRSGGVNGDYKIIVYSQEGTSKTYVIHFSCAVGKEALLEMIYLDSKPLEGFDPEVFVYFVDVTTDPNITYDAKEGQTVQVLAQQGKKILFVTKGSSSVTYTIHFGRKPSAVATLKAIYLNEESFADFDPETLEYTIPLPAGSVLPKVSYERNDEWQVVTAGYSGTTYRIEVQAENGAKNTYLFTFVIGLYTSTAPKDIQLTDHTINYTPDKTQYEVLIDRGAALPQVTVESQKGQRIVINTLNDHEQQIIVTAENGDEQTYTITYTRQSSSNATLSDIVIDGTSIEGFDPEITDYQVTLPWRTQVLPNVMPIAALTNQTIVTNYCRPDGTMTIEVTAENGVSKRTYTIAFPVQKSSNTLLESLTFEGEVPFVFDPTTTDYTITLPYGTTKVPSFEYERKEPEQRVSIESRPLGDTTKVTVTAEDGSIKTYRFAFKVKPTEAENRLRLIQYRYTRENNPDEVIEQSLVTNKQDFEVALPYGTKTFEVVYEKNYNEQVVFVQQGGISHPTVINVLANREGYEDLTYTITPEVDTQNPAVLTGITVDGTPMEDFNANRFSYVLNRTSATIPQVVVSNGSGVSCSPTLDLWSWTGVVTKDGYTNTYTIFFHYPNEVIPNGEFTEWTTQITATDGDKPSSWNVPGDYILKYPNNFTASTFAKNTVKKESESIVNLHTAYEAALYGALPAVMNLATMTAAYAVAGGSTVTPSGFISFHNTPDVATINYKYTDKAGEGALFRFSFFDQIGAEHRIDHKNNSTGSSYEDYSEDLSLSGLKITGMDIIVASAGQYPKGPTGPTTDCSSELYVDYIRFAYNSQLSALSVNGIDAALEGSAFNVALTDCEQTRIPSLAFTGQVSDQAQLITWSEENAQGVRTATIRNFAEDGSYTDYTLTVTRPLDTRNSLAGIYINGHLLPSFREEQTEYTYTMTTSQLPDITYDGGSFLQTITMGYADSVVTISVMPEQGQTKVYTIKLQRQYSSNTQLQDILPLEGFDPAVREYTIEGQQWPDFFFVKAEDKQQVTVQNGLFTITAEDGSVGTYQVKLQQPQVITSGQIKEFEIDGVVAQDFGGLQLSKTAERPTYVRFERQDLTDSVIFIQSDIAMQWQVIGTQTNTYTLTYPSEPSKNATLTAILVNDTLLSGFMPQVTTYELVTDSDFILTPVPAEASQRVEINKVGQLFQFVVTAQAGNTQTYTIDVQPTSSKDATLAELNLNGVSVPDFRPDSFTYVFTLPTPEVKVEEPVRPDIRFVTTDANASVEVESAPLGQTSVITVTSQDGTAHCTYTLLIEAEPSHNASLNGLIVNNVPLENFRKDQYYYTLVQTSDEVSVVWTADDQFLSVEQITDTLSPQLLSTNLYVTAQDGQTKNTYTVVNQFTPSGVDSLKAIYQNADLLPGFNSQKLWYEIMLEPGERRFPDLDWEKGDRNQQVRLDTTSQDLYHLTRQIAVTAADGHQKVYTIQHEIQKSNVDTLQNIFINDKPLAMFEGTKEEYAIYVDSPSQPIITFVAGDEYQTVSITELPEMESIKALNKALIMVEAENGNIRFYTLHFLLPLDNNARLQMIYKEGQPLDNFDPDILSYTILLEKDAPLPAITWLAQTAEQQVFSSTLADTTSLLVVAEDGSRLTYKLFFQHKLSENVDLAMINVNGMPMESFQPDIYQYEMFIAYGQPLPTLTAVKQEPEQTVTQTQDTIVSVNGDSVINVYFRVQAQDITFENEYKVAITLGRNTDARLLSIALRGTALKDFDPAVTDYPISFPVGSDSSVFYTVADVAYHLSDPKATALVTELDHHTLQIDVLAQDSKTRLIYTITQRILLDDNNYLSELKVGGLDMPGFTPEWDFYTYYLEEGITPPQITAVAQSEEATVSINAKAAGDTSIVVCESASKQVRKYYIYFAKSPINDTQKPTSRDVLVKYVPGTTDIVVATTRKNVTFCLYDSYGKCLSTYKLTTVNTNFADIDKDSDGYEHLFNFDNAQGLQIHLIPNQFYIYTFIEGDKRLIKSGKLLVK